MNGPNGSKNQQFLQAAIVQRIAPVDRSIEAIALVKGSQPLQANG